MHDTRTEKHSPDRPTTPKPRPDVPPQSEHAVSHDRRGIVEGNLSPNSNPARSLQTFLQLKSGEAACQLETEVGAMRNEPTMLTTEKALDQRSDDSTTDRRQIHPDLAALASLMDDCIQVPGTKFRIGLDGIIGLIPFVGDLITIAIAGFFFREAERLGVSRWTKARMYGNYAIDMLAGMVPLVGDAFDFGFKAHRRNLRLLQEHLDRHPEMDGSDRHSTIWLKPQPQKNPTSP
jgi:hypothetical protein